MRESKHHEEEEDAALRIQCLHRSKCAKRDVEQMRQEKRQKEELDHFMEDLGDQGESAALKVQSIQRGKKARQEVEKMKKEKEEVAPDPKPKAVKEVDKKRRQRGAA